MEDTLQNDGWSQVKVFQTPIHNFEETPEIAGTFIETKETGGEFKSSQYIIELEDKTQVAVWASFQLKQLFEDIKPGANVKIVYTGKIDIGEGKQVKQFEVFTK